MDSRFRGNDIRGPRVSFPHDLSGNPAYFRVLVVSPWVMVTLQKTGLTVRLGGEWPTVRPYTGLLASPRDSRPRGY